MTEDAAAPHPLPLPAWLGWLLSGLLVGYTIAVHRGVAPAVGGLSVGLWKPSGFLVDTELIGGFYDRPLPGATLLLGVPCLFTLGILASTRSAIARTTGACSIVSVALLGFYGLDSSALRVWEWFHWRGSVVIALTGLAIGCTLAAPALARSWLRLQGIWKLVVYVPVFIAVTSLIRNATGTDESLNFNISPWPAIPALGMEIGSYSLVGLQIGLAIGLATSSLRNSGTRALGFIIGALFPALWFKLRFDHTSVDVLAPILLVSIVLGMLMRIKGRRGHRHELERRAAHLAVGAALVLLPLFTGRALAEGDFAVSRFVRAQTLIDALSAHYSDEGEYPEELEQLIEGGQLDSLPVPRVGFGIYYDLGLLEPVSFDYRSLGSSYVLEFIATEWVMCAYNPPWADLEEELEDEDEEEEEPVDPVVAAAACRSECSRVCQYDCDEDDEDFAECRSDCADTCDDRCSEDEAAAAAAAEEDETGESWSCPTDRPELW